MYQKINTFWNYNVNSDCLTVRRIYPDRQVKMENFTQIFAKDKENNNKRLYPDAVKNWAAELVDKFDYDEEDALFAILGWYAELSCSLSKKELKKVVDRAFN